MIQVKRNTKTKAMNNISKVLDQFEIASYNAKKNRIQIGQNGSCAGWVNLKGKGQVVNLTFDDLSKQVQKNLNAIHALLF